MFMQKHSLVFLLHLQNDAKVIWAQYQRTNLCYPFTCTTVARSFNDQLQLFNPCCLCTALLYHDHTSVLSSCSLKPSATGLLMWALSPVHICSRWIKINQNHDPAIKTAACRNHKEGKPPKCT